jgi:hypothetical protein
MNYKDDFRKHHSEWFVKWMEKEKNLYLGANPNITMEFILKNKQHCWYAIDCIKNPNIPWEEWEPNMPLGLKGINYTKPSNFVMFIEDHIPHNMPWNIVELNLDRIDPFFLSQRKELTYDIIQRYKEKDWNWEFICKIGSIPLDLCIKSVLETNNESNLIYIGNHPSMTISIYNDLVTRLNLRYLIRQEIASRLSKNLSITWTEIENTIDTIPWSWAALSCRTDITDKIYFKYKSEWLITNILKNPCISDHIIWNIVSYYHVSNPNITPKKISTRTKSFLIADNPLLYDKIAFQKRYNQEITRKREIMRRILYKRINKDIITYLEQFYSAL